MSTNPSESLTQIDPFPSDIWQYIGEFLDIVSLFKARKFRKRWVLSFYRRIANPDEFLKFTNNRAYAYKLIKWLALQYVKTEVRGPVHQLIGISRNYTSTLWEVVAMCDNKIVLVNHLPVHKVHTMLFNSQLKFHKTLLDPTDIVMFDNKIHASEVLKKAMCWVESPHVGAVNECYTLMMVLIVRSLDVAPLHGPTQSMTGMTGPAGPTTMYQTGPPNRFQRYTSQRKK